MAFLILIVAAIVALTSACGGNDTAGIPVAPTESASSVALTPDPTTYTAPPTEKTGQTRGENTARGSGGGVIRVGGPNVENRNRSTNWPRFGMKNDGKTPGYGCTEKYNVQASVPVTIKDVQIAAPFRIVPEWDKCADYAKGHQGCKGRTLPPEPSAYYAKTPGCAMVIKIGPFTGKERSAPLRFTYEAKCTVSQGTPCSQVPASKLPATVTWTASETVTALNPVSPQAPPSS